MNGDRGQGRWNVGGRSIGDLALDHSDHMR